MKNVLLTGAGGFIGRNLYDVLTQRDNINLTAIHGKTHGYDLVKDYMVFDEGRINNTYGDLNDPDFLSYLSAQHYDVVFHLAGIAQTKAKDEDLFEANVKATFNLLQIAEGARFIFTSSSTVYGNGHRHIHFDESDKCLPTSFYGASKLMCENMINTYTQNGRVKGVNLRLCANVGEYSKKGLLPDLVRKLRLDNDSVELFGEAPGSIKPFIHVSDTVNAILHFVNTDHRLSWNVCPNDTLSVEQIVKLVESVMIVTKERKWLGRESVWAGDNPEFAMSNAKLVRTGFNFQYKNSEAAIMAALKDLL